jgi:hypothetical protein
MLRSAMLTADPIRGAAARLVSSLQTVRAIGLPLLRGTIGLAGIIFATSAMAQPIPSGPPPVGVIKVERRPMTDTYEFNGRIQAINSVNIVACVTGSRSAAGPLSQMHSFRPGSAT